MRYKNKYGKINLINYTIYKNTLFRFNKGQHYIKRRVKVIYENLIIVII